MKPALIEVYKKIAFIRIAEEEIANLYLNQKIMSFVHFYVGQEAVAVGVCNALETQDRVLGNHRSHGHYLAKGGDFRKMICELLGKEYGSSHGKGGSMHMIDTSVDFIGSTPILGSVVPIAAGSAFEQKYNRIEKITVAFFGDGASEEGVVYETMNIAALYKLPLLLVIENNLYSVNSKLSDRRSPGYNIQQLVSGIGLEYVRADGNDYEDVHSKAMKLSTSVREGKPAVLECMTYRHMAHSAPIMDDAQGYREEDPIEIRLERDPLKKIRSALLAEGKTNEELDEILQTTREKILSDIDFAVKAAYPNPKELYTDVYA